MRVYVSVDMEGVAGIATVNQVRRGTDDYPRSRSLMTAEANAAIEGAYDGGATYVLVNDSHGDMANLLAEQLDARAELLTGSPKLRFSMMEGITSDFAVALFVGYHAGPGTERGVLAHTYSSAVFSDVRLNGETQTEAELNARIAAGFGVPVGLVTGDDHTCDVAQKRIQGVRTVVVKRGLGFEVAANMHPQAACDAIRSAAREAVEGSAGLPLVALDGPFVLECDVVTLRMADVCANVPGCSRPDGRTVRYEADDYAKVFRCLLTWMYLGNSTLRA